MTAQSPSADRSARGLAGPRPGIDETKKKLLFTSGSGLGALAMSSCCIVPLVLFSLGVTGAWLGGLTALYPYKWFFFVPTAGFLAAGFYMVYRTPRATECAPEAFCAAPTADRVTKIVLWSATVLVLAALAFPYVAPIFLAT